MAEKDDGEYTDDICPCTHPELPQFKSLSEMYPTASKGKRLLWKSCPSCTLVLALHLFVLTQC